MGRFESNFVESRRAALEKMLNKAAAHPTLQHDSDLKLFLESEAFNVDVKHKERKEPNLGESKGIMSTLVINVGGGVKFVEQDDVSRPFRTSPLLALVLVVVALFIIFFGRC